MKYIAIIIVIFFTTKAFTQNSFVNDSLETYINKGLKDWQVPGLAVVIVKDGKVIISKGFGVKNITTNEPVDANTLFFIASNSKLFTGTALANLEVEKKLNLNDKITKFYPEYKLYDKTSTELVTIKDMLTHRIGTKTFQGDFTFWNTKLSRQEVMKSMQYLKPINGFRDAYGYCNSCFLTAGMVIPKVAGVSWEQYVQDKIVTPLQMKNTYVTSNGIEKRVKNMATPYTTSFTNKLQPVPYDTWDNLGPAASIVSSVNDMRHWLQFQLDSGKYEGKQIMPWAALQKTRDVQIITGSRKSSTLPVHFRGYGLGVFSADYNGKQIYWHTGGAGGMVSNVCFVPEENLGICILTNNDNQNLFELLRYQILDSYLGVPYVNRSQQQLKGFNDEMENQIKEVEQWRKEVDQLNKGLDTLAVNENQKYEGMYKHKLYGSIKIKKIAEHQLSIQFLSHTNLTANLYRMPNEEWLMEYNNIEYGIFKTKFIFEKNGIVKGISIKANDFVEYDAYDFEKVNLK